MRSLQREARATRVWELRLSGFGFKEIGKELGICPATAFDDLRIARSLFVCERIEDLALQTVARLDRALTVVMDKLAKGSLPAVDKLIAIESFKADLLGLRAARELNLTVKADAKANLLAFVGQIRQNMAEQGIEVDEITSASGVGDESQPPSPSSPTQH